MFPMTAEDKAARPGFVNKAQLPLGLGEALDEFIDGIQRAADDALGPHLRGVLRRDGDGDRSLVDVQTEVMHDFLHGCLVSFQW